MTERRVRKARRPRNHPGFSCDAPPAALCRAQASVCATVRGQQIAPAAARARNDLPLQPLLHPAAIGNASCPQQSVFPPTLLSRRRLGRYTADGCRDPKYQSPSSSLEDLDEFHKHPEVKEEDSESDVPSLEDPGFTLESADVEQISQQKRWRRAASTSQQQCPRYAQDHRIKIWMHPGWISNHNHESVAHKLVQMEDSDEAERLSEEFLEENNAHLVSQRVFESPSDCRFEDESFWAEETALHSGDEVDIGQVVCFDEQDSEVEYLDGASSDGLYYEERDEAVESPLHHDMLSTAQTTRVGHFRSSGRVDANTLDLFCNGRWGARRHEQREVGQCAARRPFTDLQHPMEQDALDAVLAEFFDEDGDEYDQVGEEDEGQEQESLQQDMSANCLESVEQTDHVETHTKSATVAGSSKKRKPWRLRHQDNTPLIAPPGQRIPGMPALQDLQKKPHRPSSSGSNDLQASSPQTSSLTSKEFQATNPQEPPTDTRRPAPVAPAASVFFPQGGVADTRSPAQTAPAAATSSSEDAVVEAIKIRLSGVWSGINGETYEFEFSPGLVWRCWRCYPNRVKDYPAKFQVKLDMQNMWLRWAASYFMDIADLKGDSDVRWYRVNDHRKTQVRFIWSRASRTETPGGTTLGPLTPAQKRCETQATCSRSHPLTMPYRTSESRMIVPRRRLVPESPRKEPVTTAQSSAQRAEVRLRQRQPDQEPVIAAANISDFPTLGAAKEIARNRLEQQKKIKQEEWEHQQQLRRQAREKKHRLMELARAAKASKKKDGRRGADAELHRTRASYGECAAELASVAVTGKMVSLSASRASNNQESAHAGTEQSSTTQNSRSGSLHAELYRHSMAQTVDQSLSSRTGSKEAEARSASPFNPQSKEVQMDRNQGAKVTTATNPTLDVKDLAVSAGEPPDPRPHLHIAMLGPASSGKSVLCGAILHKVGVWDERQLNKHKKECDKEGIGEVRRYEECGTSNLRFTLLDIPGKRKSLPQAARAVCIADVCVAVVSAKGQEFEAAVSETSGSFREQLYLARGFGVQALIVAVSKMGEANWAQEHFDTIRTKLLSVIAELGVSTRFVGVVPVDGLSGTLDAEEALWFSDLPLLKQLEKISKLVNTGPGHDSSDLPARLLLQTVSRNKGGTSTASGRVDCGSVRPGLRCIAVPMQSLCILQAVLVDGKAVSCAQVGESVQLRIAGLPVDASDKLGLGVVLCDEKLPVQAVAKIKVEVDVLQMPDNMPLITPGFKGVLHIHAATVDFEIAKILKASTPSSGQVEQKPKGAKVGQRAAMVLQLDKDVAAEEFCEGKGRLGLLVLRAGDVTVAIGYVKELPKS